MKRFLYIIAISSVAFASCDYDYLTDGGVHDPHVDMTTYDFMATHSWQVFDTLLLLIDHHNMKEEVNNAGTLVAVTDYSFKSYMRFGWTLDSLKKYVTADTLRNYLFDQPILFEGLSTTDKVFVAESGTDFIFKLQELNNTEWTATPAYSLYIGRQVGASLVSNLCQTTNIQTNTGVIHALTNQHNFNWGL